MAIADMNYLQKSHRLSLYRVAETVKEIHPGQLFHLNDNGEWDYADGTRKAYPTINSRFAGLGLGKQGERLEGRDEVSRSGKLACLASGYEIGTDQYDPDATYKNGSALIASTDPAKKGLVTMFDSANSEHKAHLIVGYVTQVPSEPGDFLRYQG